MRSGRLTRRGLLGWFGLGAAGAALAACGGPPAAPAAPTTAPAVGAATGAAPTSPPAATAVQAKPAAGAKPTIAYMHYESGALSEVRTAHAEAYNQKPDRLATVEVNVVPHDQLEAKRGALIAAGTGPDIFHTQGGSQAVATNAPVLLDLDPLIAKDRPRVQPEQYYPRILQYMKHQGKTLIWPSLPVVMVLGYNKDLFDQAGVKYPTNDWTYDDLLRAAQALTKKDASGKPAQWGLTVDRKSYIEWMQGMWARGGEVLTDDLKKIRLNEPFGVETLQWMFDKVNKHGVSPGPGQDIQGDFLSGKIAIDWVTHTSTYAARNKAGLNWDVVMLPKGPVERGPRIAMDCYHLLQSGKHHDATFDFFIFANSVEQMTRTAEAGVAPTRKDVAAATWLKGTPGARAAHPQNVQNFFETLDHVRHIPASRYFLKLTLDFVTPQLDAMFEQKKTPEQAAVDAARECNEFLASQTEW